MPWIGFIFSFTVIFAAISYFGAKHYRGLQDTENFLTNLPSEEIEMLKNLELIEHYEIIQDLNILEDMDILEKLDELGS